MLIIKEIVVVSPLWFIVWGMLLNCIPQNGNISPFHS